MGQDQEDQEQADPTAPLIESDQKQVAPEGPTPEKAVVKEAAADKERRLSQESHANLYRIGGEVRDVLLDKRHRVLILARILLAVPVPAFLVFSAVQHFQPDTFLSSWGLSASFTQLQAGKEFAIFVGLLALPLWILSLLVAQIEEKRPGSLQEWLTAYDEQRLESFPLGWLKAFCKRKEVGLSVSGKREDVIVCVKEWLKKRRDEDAPKKKSTPGTMINQGAPWDFFMSHKQNESGRDVALITRDLEQAGKRVWLDVNMGDCSTAAMMEGVEHSETFVLVLSDGYFDSEFCKMELRRAFSLPKNIVLCHKQGVNVGAILQRRPSDPEFANIGAKQSLELIINDAKLRKFQVDRLIESAEAPKKDSTSAPPPPNGTPTLTTESTEAKPKPTPKARLVSLWKNFLGLLKWDPRIWSWPKAVEAALFFGSVFGYAAIYNTTTLSAIVMIYLVGTPISLLIVNVVTKVVRSTINYQYDQKVPFQTFVSKQAYRLSIHTIFGLCVATYGLSAMSRVVVPSNLQGYFQELSLNGISCTDRDAFWTAFEASAANATCPALPKCGYASFEDLCQAVQYAPMVRAVGVDVSKVLLYNFVAWLFISLLVFGTGRASPTNGYAKLLSRHMLVAMMLGLAQLLSAFYAFMRLLLLVPLLRLPRPAAYFDRTDLMVGRELPLVPGSYGTFANYDFWVTILVHVLIAVALNFDFLKTSASRLRLRDEAKEQKAIDNHKEKMRKKIWNEEKKESECEWSDAAPYFYFVPARIVLECQTRSLPHMQALRDVGHLEKITISLVDAFNGVGVIKKILFVSHRWEEPGRPDFNGVQLEAIKAYLEKHAEIEWVWFDYSSMPQKIATVTRTLEEKAEFQLMRERIVDLCLTARVLILLDGSYASRFWTLTEAWCSMQTATREGLLFASRDSTGSDVLTRFRRVARRVGSGEIEIGSRCTIKCIHNETQETAGNLVDLVFTKTPKGMLALLKKPDVNGNAKDKEAMLPVIQDVEKHVMEGFVNGFQKLQSHQSTSGSTPASPKSGKQTKWSQVAPSDSNAVTSALNDQ